MCGNYNSGHTVSLLRLANYNPLNYTCTVQSISLKNKVKGILDGVMWRFEPKTQNSGN